MDFPQSNGSNRVCASSGEYAPRSPTELTQLMRTSIPPRGLTSAFGGMIALVDGMIHQQDIRRPLGQQRIIAPDRLRTVLNYRTRGVRLIATDLDWNHGDGLEVTGPAEALLMAMAARPDAFNQLTGPGKELLAQRICD